MKISGRLLELMKDNYHGDSFDKLLTEPNNLIDYLKTLKVMPLSTEYYKPILGRKDVCYVSESFVIYNRLSDSYRLDISPRKEGDGVCSILKFDGEQLLNFTRELMILGYEVTGMVFSPKEYGDELVTLIFGKESYVKVLKTQLEDAAKRNNL